MDVRRHQSFNSNAKMNSLSDLRPFPNFEDPEDIPPPHLCSMYRWLLAGWMNCDSSKPRRWLDLLTELIESIESNTDVW